MIDTMNKIRKEKVLRIIIGMVLGICGFLLFVSLNSFIQNPVFQTLFITLFCLFGFFLILWYVFSDLGFFLNVIQQKKLAKKDTFFIMKDDENLQDINHRYISSEDDFLNTTMPKITKTPRATGACAKERLDEIHGFLEKIDNKKETNFRKNR